MAKKPSTKENIDLGSLDMSSTVDNSTHGMITAHPVMPLREEKAGLKFFQARRKEIPFYATEYAAGFDLKADLEAGDVVSYYNHSNSKNEKKVRENEGKGRLYIEPGERVLVPTGLFADIPNDSYIAIHSRSGTSWKQGLILTNGVGVIDADYVEEIKVSLTNNSGARVYIEDGERIAQGLLMAVCSAPIASLTTKPAQKTSRAGGFGSTGSK